MGFGMAGDARFDCHITSKAEPRASATPPLLTTTTRPLPKPTPTRLTQQTPINTPHQTKTHQWERVKKVGMAPGARASFGWAVHKGTRAFLFGGVSDNEAKGGEDLSSEFHNDLYTFSFLNRWGGGGCVLLWGGLRG